LTQQLEDTVFLRGLAIETTIGFFEWERLVKQTVVIDLEIPVDCAKAAASDEVVDTTDYKSIAKRTIQYVGDAQFKLVETLAHKLAATLIDEFGLAWIKLSLNKPGAIRGSRDVGVSIVRRRASA
jgi:7,8-dihydroneopterin aldolase/epimerase/oxygenase